jgi:hypothetical protein
MIHTWVDKVNGSGQLIEASYINDLQDKKLDAYDAGAYASFAAAVAAMGATVCPLNVTGAETLAGNVTTPATMNLIIHKGAPLTIPNGITLTINGPYTAGLYQTFICTGTGKVVFGAGAVKEVYPEWWTTNTTPGTTEMGVAIQKAIDSINSGSGDTDITKGGTVKFSKLYKTTTAIVSAGDGVNLSGSTAGRGTVIVGYGAINILELGNGTDAIYGGSISDITVKAGDTDVTRCIYARKAHQHIFRDVIAFGGSTAAVEIVDCYIQRWYGGQALGATGKGFYLHHGASVSNDIQFFGTVSRNNTGIGFDDDGGAGRTYDVLVEENLGGGIQLAGVQGADLSGGYFEQNTGYDVKISTGCAGISLAGGYYLNYTENNHKFIWLLGCYDVSIGVGFMEANSGKTGNVGVYIGAGTSGIHIDPFTLTLNGGATGTPILNDHGAPSPQGVLMGEVHFASTATWRTVAIVEFLSTDFGGGYLEFAFGGVQANVGGANAILTGTFFKDTAGNPTFTQITNVVNNAVIQATNNGDSQVVVQMKSSSGGYALYGNFALRVMGGILNKMLVTTPGYFD